MNEKLKILIADDSEINRALLKEILGDGYDYLEAEDGAAAVELMRQRTDINFLNNSQRIYSALNQRQHLLTAIKYVLI